MLEGGYPSILNFCKFIEYHENSIEDVILTLPKCEDFYSNKVLEFIKEKNQVNIYFTLKLTQILIVIFIDMQLTLIRDLIWKMKF